MSQSNKIEISGHLVLAIEVDGQPYKTVMSPRLVVGEHHLSELVDWLSSKKNAQSCADEVKSQLNVNTKSD